MRRFISLSSSFCHYLYPKADTFEGSSSLFFLNPLWVHGFHEVVKSVALTTWTGSRGSFTTG